MPEKTPHIAIIGGGPIGLEAALYARLKSYDVTLYEQRYIAENVDRWGHIRMFSPFGMNSSEWGRAALQEVGVEVPAGDALLTGHEYLKQYLQRLSSLPPLLAAIKQHHCVSEIVRANQHKAANIGSPRRSDDPFEMLIVPNQGGEHYARADVVLDCSGTWTDPRRLGPGGMRCIGEEYEPCGDLVDYWPVNPGHVEYQSMSDRHLLLIGSGHSAASSAITLSHMAEEMPGMTITWLTRRDTDEPITRIENDRLPQRDRIAAEANRLATESDGIINWRPGWSVVHINWGEIASDNVKVTIRRSGSSDEETLDANHIIANVGYRPDRRLYDELQVHECYATQGPMKLAAKLLGETSADCLDQQSHGAEVLRNPEPNFYILGMKSYGRSSNFLIQVGLQQIVDVFSLIEQDWGT